MFSELPKCSTFKPFLKSQHVKMCSEILKYYDTIWCDSINMSRLVKIVWYDLIQFLKHVQTCWNTMIRFDTILQTCPDLSKWFDTIRKTCWDLSKTKRWWNTQKFEWMTDKVTHYKAIPRTAFDKRAVKNMELSPIYYLSCTGHLNLPKQP